LIISNSTNTADFGFYFAPREGKPGADHWIVRMDASDTNVQIFENVTTNDPPTFSIPKTWLADLHFHGNDGDDSLTVDYSNGSPAPSDGIEFNGGNPSASDTLFIVGSAGADTATFDVGSVTLNGTVTYTNVEHLNFDGAGGDDIVTV